MNLKKRIASFDFKKYSMAGRTDFGVLKVAFMVAALDGDAVTNIAPDANEKNLNVLCGADGIGNVTFPEVKKPSDAAGFFSVGASETKVNGK